MLIVTMLCGAPRKILDQRFSVLVRTCERARKLLELADEVICLANFGDERTRDWLRDQSWKPRVLFTKRRAGNPEATELVLTAAVQAAKERGHAEAHVLHLEDDWWLVDEDPLSGWLGHARGILMGNPQVGQVRLRMIDDHMPLGFNWVTGAAIVREQYPGYMVSNQHLTYNPALWRLEAITTSFPPPGAWRDEQASMACYERAGWRSAQLVPGVFIHRDNGASVEGVVGR